MSILNRPSHGLVSVLIALRNTLLAYGPLSKEDLIDTCAPKSLVPDGKQDMAKKTLHKWTGLGFFEERSNRIHLAQPLRELSPDDLDSLRSAVLKIVLRLENNPTVATDPEANSEGSGASDFTRAACWALMQDPYNFPTRFRDVESLQNGQGTTPAPFVNDTRWAGFASWATFLGVGSESKAGFVPVPVFAVRVALEDVFGKKTELGQESFFAGLAASLPIVEGGPYRQIVEDQTPRKWRKFAQNETSPCLAAALQSLEASGDLRLESRSDAPQKHLIGLDGKVRQVSHFVLVRGA